MRFLRPIPRDEETESPAWEEEIAGTLPQQLTDAYTAAEVPADLYSKIESAARMDRFSPRQSGRPQVRLFPRIAASGLLAACMLAAAIVLVAHHSTPKTASPRGAFGTSKGLSRRSHEIVPGPSGVPVFITGKQASALSIRAAAWRARSPVVVVGYSVKPPAASSMDGFVLLSPNLEWNHRFLPPIGCPAVLGGPTTGYTAYLCFSLPGKQDARRKPALVLSSDGLRLVPTPSKVHIASPLQSAAGPVGPAVRNRMVVRVNTVSPGRVVCALGNEACGLSLTFHLTQRVFLDKVIPAPANSSHLPAPQPTRLP